MGERIGFSGTTNDPMTEQPSPTPLTARQQRLVAKWRGDEPGWEMGPKAYAAVEAKLDEYRAALTKCEQEKAAALADSATGPLDVEWLAEAIQKSGFPTVSIKDNKRWYRLRAGMVAAEYARLAFQSSGASEDETP